MISVLIVASVLAGVAMALRARGCFEKFLSTIQVEDRAFWVSIGSPLGIEWFTSSFDQIVHRAQLICLGKVQCCQSVKADARRFVHSLCFMIFFAVILPVLLSAFPHILGVIS